MENLKKLIVSSTVDFFQQYLTYFSSRNVPAQTKVRSKRPLIRLKNPLIPTIPLISCLFFRSNSADFLHFLFRSNSAHFLLFSLCSNFAHFLHFLFRSNSAHFLHISICSNFAHFLHFFFCSNSAHFLHFFLLKFRSFRSKKCKGFERILLNCPLKLHSFLSFFSARSSARVRLLSN